MRCNSAHPPPYTFGQRFLPPPAAVVQLASRNQPMPGSKQEQHPAVCGAVGRPRQVKRSQNAKLAFGIAELFKSRHSRCKEQRKAPRKASRKTGTAEKSQASLTDSLTDSQHLKGAVQNAVETQRLLRPGTEPRKLRSGTEGPAVSESRDEELCQKRDARKKHLTVSQFPPHSSKAPLESSSTAQRQQCQMAAAKPLPRNLKCSDGADIESALTFFFKVLRGPKERRPCAASDSRG